jgi:hypothetical protein
MTPDNALFVQTWAFTSVRSLEGTVGYQSGDRWSAAGEGVLAALRLSKSTQSADKVHFSDSSELGLELQNSSDHYQLLAVTNGQYCSESIKLVRYLSQLG